MISKRIDFNNEINHKIRIIFEIANNHQGSVDHFKNILDDIFSASKTFADKFEFLIKFQFRDLPTFIDESIDPSQNKHISRFKETALLDEQWLQILNMVRDKGFKTIVTPFDEASVNKAERFGIEEYKIASCSCTEWSLLREVANQNKPVTISTGGRNLKEVDDIYSYFAHRIPYKFTIMHCCGIYPAPIKDLNLNTINIFKERYPLAKIGYSGHEDPDNHSISSLAIALGAVSIERHIGKEDTEKDININTYSVSSSSIYKWLKVLDETLTSLGKAKDYSYKNQVEYKSLKTLQRGVFLKNEVKIGDKINLSDCSFKFPIQENQISASEIASIDNCFIANQNLISGARLTYDKTQIQISKSISLKEYVHKIRGIINQYGEYVPDDVEIEVSHHYGIEKLNKYGCCLINIINRSYCKKLIIMTEGQNHPTQFHDVKEETFRVLHGELELILDGQKKIIKCGEEALVRSGVKHSFRAITDCIIEELSTTSIADDSIYEDTKINDLPRGKRKTLVNLHFDHFDE
ncbi:N-acetylneuraminate synthase [Prochlorococcus marinus str. MIT 9312]|uniref:N-acetylneuraminate synthase n=1 Tax=Prochlorococcus marinus (strain MIT 9312) TaxID=74546 RepID=Q319P5_PROM9|nr:N-acetylneuraminate synthase family protein [Prochlorococcus marinus]ABB50400.1 N-acetylneuraminate synthase [Prochlorococcus marinus str. MIT 9312]KGF99803.1 N-acetylneuraminate synthase [Prochlorococcus marinus str. MIT 9311]